MMLLRIALCLWLTVFCFSYQWYGIVVVLGLYLLVFFPKKQMLCYLGCSAFVLFHFLMLPTSPPTKYDGYVSAIKENYVVVTVGEQAVMINNVRDLSYDDHISFHGAYEPIDGFRNVGLFQYARFRSHQHMYYQLYATSYTLLEHGGSIKSQLYQKVLMEKNKAFQTIARRFLFQELREEEHDVVSVLMSSGMHVSTLSSWVERMISFFVVEQMVPIVAMLFPMGLLLCFGSQLTLYRILLKYLLRFTSLSAQSKVGLSMMLLLLLEPHYGFYLSFSIPMTLRLALLFRHHAIPTFLYRTLLLAPMLLLTSFSFTIFQMFLFPLFRSLFAFLYGASLFCLSIPWLQPILICLYEGTISWVERVAEATSFGITMKVSLLFCMLWIFGLCLLQKNSKRYRIYLGLLVMIQSLVYLRPWGEITFLDVGQGDATFISLPFRQGTMLIDTGGHRSLDIAELVLVPFLRSKGITSLDLVILTHSDLDHSGALSSLQSSIKIKQVIQDKQNLPETILMGTMPIRFLLYDSIFENENDNGLIPYLQFGDRRLLFMGDVGVDVERVLIKQYELLACDFLHVGHHGSNSSSSLPFLSHVNPAHAIISSGRNNQYRHPHPDVVTRLEQENINHFNTQQLGSISLFFIKTMRFYQTYSDSFGIINAVIS